VLTERASLLGVAWQDVDGATTNISFVVDIAVVASAGASPAFHTAPNVIAAAIAVAIAKLLIPPPIARIDPRQASLGIATNGLRSLTLAP
jgi:hypothetical protein